MVFRVVHLQVRVVSVVQVVRVVRVVRVVQLVRVVRVVYRVQVVHVAPTTLLGGCVERTSMCCENCYSSYKKRGRF